MDYSLPWHKMLDAMFRQLNPTEVLGWAMIFVLYTVAACLLFRGSKARWGILGGWALYYVLAFYITVFRRVDQVRPPNFTLFTFWRNETVYRAALFDYFLNFILFVPLGFLFVLLWRSGVIKPLFLGSMLSFLMTSAIEFTQLFAQRGVFAIDDIISNTAGGIFGCIAGLIARTLYYHIRSGNRALRKKTEVDSITGGFH